ncbi:hypothetical protein MNAN1_002697 [Malassezia nana]|uniref:Wax synthase domain-containing protein n=1 Tax=Malassezia nana TaxID=180528 RepID=A0AAF0ENG6_9BASI|nr:hypothetical protein MNAN1_002697 [Malassezia nana]
MSAWADGRWFSAGLPLPRALNPALVLVPRMPRFLDLVPQLRVRENIWSYWLGPWGAEVKAYPGPPFSLETFCDEALRMILDLVLFFFLACLAYRITAHHARWRCLAALLLIHVLYTWSLVLHGQSALINFLRAALAFRTSLLVWDIFTIRTPAEVQSWSMARTFAQLWLFPVEVDDLPPDEPADAPGRTRLRCLQGIAEGLVYMVGAQLFLPLFPPMEVVRVMPKYQYMIYVVFMVLGLYVMLSSFGVLATNVAGLFLGVEQAPLFENPFCTTSVQQFWSRWNRAIATVLHRVIFGGRNTFRSKQRRAPPSPNQPPPPLSRFAKTSLTALATFLVSGLFHEFLLYCATPGLFGWQTLFFVLNGVLAVLSNALARYAPGVVRCTPIPVRFALLVLFACVTSHLFFIPLQTHNMLAEPQMLFQHLVLPRDAPPRHAYFVNLFPRS